MMLKTEGRGAQKKQKQKQSCEFRPGDREQTRMRRSVWSASAHERLVSKIVSQECGSSSHGCSSKKPFSISAEHTDPDPLKPGAEAGGGRNVLVLLHCCDRLKESKS